MSINYSTNLHFIQEETRQADPLNKEEVLNQRKQRNKSFKKIITFLLVPSHTIM